MHLHIWIVQRRKKPQSLDMIHMHMREQDVDAFKIRRKADTKAANTCTRIQYQQGACIPSHFDARRIATISCSIWSGRGQ